MRKPLLAPASAVSRRHPTATPPVQRPISPALLVLLLILCAAPASAQPLETVEVDANALVGLWRVDFPSSGTIPEFFRVYDVEFANGHRICGLHQSDDGTIDGLRCV